MFSNIYTEYLLFKGWEQSSPMVFTNAVRPDVEIFFDNSNQIETYISGKRIRSCYLETVDDVDKILTNILG